MKKQSSTEVDKEQKKTWCRKTCYIHTSIHNDIQKTIQMMRKKEQIEMENFRFSLFNRRLPHFNQSIK